MIRQTALLLFIFFLAIVACDSIQEKSQSIIEKTSTKSKRPINPNGDSELALMMRALYEEADSVRKQIAEGKKVNLSLDHSRILSAHATEPEKVATAEYKGFAQLYLHHVKQLQGAEGEEAQASFNALVESCLSCHKALCPGPVVRIKKLQKPYKPTQ
tara:strand:- start:128 stop:601 length:474 start_codon:yes stop_codon:yes gene_type:complete